MHEGGTASPIALPMRALAALLYGSAGSLSAIHCSRTRALPLAVRREVSVLIFESACHWAPPFVPSSWANSLPKITFRCSAKRNRSQIQTGTSGALEMTRPPTRAAYWLSWSRNLSAVALEGEGVRQG